MITPTKKPIMIPQMPVKKKPSKDAKNISAILINNFLRLILSKMLATVSDKSNAGYSI